MRDSIHNCFARTVCVGAALLFACAASLLLADSSATGGTGDTRITSPVLPGIHNFLSASKTVFSGSHPEGDEAFAALAKLGVKTIVSVDGAKPDVRRATKHGIRYIHLPFGYDGIPASRVAELVKVVATVPGPIYVHCHHGKHRGPAAVAVMCMVSEGWKKERAETFLHQAGTAPEYTGLFRAVSGFTLPEPAKLAAVSTNFPAIAQGSTLVEAMVAMDEHLENLSRAGKVDWKNTPGHPDSTPSHEALLLLEQLRELARAEATAKRPEAFREQLTQATQIAEVLQAQLRRGDGVQAGAAFKQLNQSCVRCHERYRNE